MPPHPRLREVIERGEVAPPRAMTEPASSPSTAPTLEFDRPQGGPRQFTNPAQGDSVSLNALAVVVDFGDNVKTATATYFDTLIFAAPVAGRGSVRDYYREVSYGAVDIVTVNLPSSMGWQRAPQTYGYYVWNGYCVNGAYPNNCQKLAEDIVDIVNGVVNFGNYDNDGDGYAEPIMLIHAGPGAEFTGSTTDVWSHSWSLSTARNYDGVTIADYVIMPEYWTTVSAATSDMTIGVFAHEMGHGFWGLPDVYDRDSSSEGAGSWSLMAGGSWNGPNSGGWGPDGSSPAWPDAWDRTQMGFVTATQIHSNVIGRSIPQAYGNPPPAQTVLKLRSAVLGAKEYFLLENRQQVPGSYDEYLPGSGLLIWHVDEAMNVYSIQNDYECTIVPHCQCSDSHHYLLALEQADGLLDLEYANDSGDTGDPFPGNTSNRTWTMFTNPESSSWYSSRCDAVPFFPLGERPGEEQTASSAPITQAQAPGVQLTTHSPPTSSLGKAAPPANPDAVLWDQPLSTASQTAWVDQEFPDQATYSSYLADDFVNTAPWTINTIFIPGDGWNGFSTLFNATALTWQIYADCAGVPCGDPSGGGSLPVWTLTLSPTDPQVSITAGAPGGYPSNTTLALSTPVNLPVGHWWLVFYPTMGYTSGGQYGRQPSDTANGYTGQFINPGGAFGYGTAWQAWAVLGPTQSDIAFRLEGQVSGSGCTDTCIGVTNISNSGPTMIADIQVSCGPTPDNWAYLPLVLKNKALAVGVLWDQPLSTVNQIARVDQEFPNAPTYSSYLADDFVNNSPWIINIIFVPGDGWDGFSTLFNATALTWQIYGDCAGVPCGDPSGGGFPPAWSLTLPPTAPQVSITAGAPGGYPSNTTLTLSTPVNLPAGHWWLVFYPTMNSASGGQYGRQPADTANGYTGQFINPGGGFGLGTGWQAWTVLGGQPPDIAFRLEGSK